MKIIKVVTLAAALLTASFSALADEHNTPKHLVTPRVTATSGSAVTQAQHLLSLNQFANQTLYVAYFDGTYDLFVFGDKSRPADPSDWGSLQGTVQHGVQHSSTLSQAATTTCTLIDNTINLGVLSCTGPTQSITLYSDSFGHYIVTDVSNPGNRIDTVLPTGSVVQTPIGSGWNITNAMTVDAKGSLLVPHAFVFGNLYTGTFGLSNGYYSLRTYSNIQ